MALRNAGSLHVGSGTPSMEIDPCCGSQLRVSNCNKVDLPQPVRPSKANFSPCLIFSDKCLTTGLSLP